jgi:DNA-binding transcriptional ArsR family regulator
MFGSRPAASRHLGALTRAGVLWRFVYDTDSSHLAHYELTPGGIEALSRHLRREGRPVPVGIGAQLRDQHLISYFRVGLAAASRADGRGHLYRWRRALEAAALLRNAGIPHVHPRAYGEWIEKDMAVRFLLHTDHADPYPLVEPPPPSRALAGYRDAGAGVPATAVLVVTNSEDRHRALLRELAVNPLPVAVAVTTTDALYDAISASEQIWSIPGAEAAGRARLIDLSRQ